MLKQLTALAAAAVLVLAGAAPSIAKDGDKASKRRGEIDAMASATMERLFSESPSAKSNYDAAYGYAVFQNLKIALGLSGGGGAGVAVDKATGEQTYMRMGTAGVGIGLGGKKYQVVFLFETKEIFDNFVEKGWQADTSANAVAGTAGASAESTFNRGLLIYQIDDAGLMANAEVAGTKYWKYTKLN